MSQATKTQTNIRKKTFRYENKLSWLAGRSGLLESKEKPSLRVSSPPEFGGDKDLWTPEDMYIGALNACTMSSFLVFAERRKAEILSYESKAMGILEFTDGKYWFTSVQIEPKIVVSSSEFLERAEQALRDAHDKCFITNSVKSIVTVQPKIEIRQG